MSDGKMASHDSDVTARLRRSGDEEGGWRETRIEKAKRRAEMMRWREREKERGEGGRKGKREGGKEREKEMAKP